jgi:hypothetical protein
MKHEDNRTPSYVELSSQAYALFVEALASANHRALGYAKSLYEVASHPYAAATLESGLRESFERAHQIVELTVDELQASGLKNAEFAEKLAAQGAKLQDTWTHAMRGLLKTGLSNLTYVKESAETSFDGFTRRFEELQLRGTRVSPN